MRFCAFFSFLLSSVTQSLTDHTGHAPRTCKLENLLFDEKGYLKLVDFGFAKKIESKTFTLCGTPDYLAPELLAGRGHNHGVDWWTLGVLT